MQCNPRCDNGEKHIKKTSDVHHYTYVCTADLKEPRTQEKNMNQAYCTEYFNEIRNLGNL